jgi:monofunctional glycosyltransferase
MRSDFVRRGIRSLWKHKIKTFVAAGLLIIAIDLMTLPYGEIARLKSKNPQETAFMRERREKEGKNKPFRQRWIPLKQIPKDVINAVVVSEDATFWWHGGFDWYEFRESVQRNLSDGRAVRGASTITQQLVKNLFLSSSKNPIRKLREWALTWNMERTLTKRRILELYLNVIEWGDRIYGIEAASREYFQKPASSLSREEAARLAATIPSPRNRRPDEESTYLNQRATLILKRMNDRGM